MGPVLVVRYLMAPDLFRWAQQRDVVCDLPRTYAGTFRWVIV
jgi:hypothetical protein